MLKSGSMFAGNAPGIMQHAASEQHSLASMPQGHYGADSTSGSSQKRHHGMAGHYKGSMQQGTLFDSTITAAVQCGLGNYESSCPPEWHPSPVQDPAVVPVAGNAAGQHSSHTLSCPVSSMGTSDMTAARHYSSSNGSSPQLLYSTYRTEQEYTAAQLSASQSTRQQQAQANAQRAMSHDQAVRSHQEHLLRQQQQQLLLQRYQAEAAAAAKAAVLQQQQQHQAALARSAAVASSSQGSHPQTIPLYGNYSRATAQQQHCQWTVAAAPALAPAPTSEQSAYTHHAAGAAASLQHQQLLQRQVALGAAALPPWQPPASSGSKKQQQQEVARAAAAADANHAAYHSSAVRAAHHGSTRMPPQQLAEQQSFVSGSSGRASAATAFSAPAAQYSARAVQGGQVDRWSGQLGFMEAPVAIACSQTSDGNSGHMLECDEELMSMGTGEGYCFQPQSNSRAAAAAAAFDVSCRGGYGRDQQQRQQHMYDHHIELAQAEVEEELQNLIEESGSTKDGSSEGEDDDMDHDQDCDSVDATNVAHGSKHVGDLDLDSTALVAAKAAATAVQQAAQARQSVVLQVLGRVAKLRKGYSAVNSSPTASFVARAESVRPRLLITEVSLYAEQAANSQMALDQANKLMRRMRLPDNAEYMSVASDSFLFKAGAAWQFPAFVICLGSSYLQRMLVRLPQLAEAVLACPGFEDYALHLPGYLKPVLPPPRLSGPEAVATLATLRSVQFTCLFLATKVADQIHALGLLRFMLTNLSQNGAVVSIQQAANVEACCLEALGWRLGPFFLEDELTGNDEELWAESMGHLDYGTFRDTYPDHF